MNLSIQHSQLIVILIQFKRYTFCLILNILFSIFQVVVDVEEDGEFFIKGKSATPKSLFGTQSSSS